jgi:hypothetical protein
MLGQQIAGLGLSVYLAVSASAAPGGSDDKRISDSARGAVLKTLADPSSAIISNLVVKRRLDANGNLSDVIVCGVVSSRTGFGMTEAQPFAWSANRTFVVIATGDAQASFQVRRLCL